MSTNRRLPGTYTTWILSIVCYFVFLGTATANSVISATIDAQSANRLVVKFDESVNVSDAAGFRLIGGVARIDRLLFGSGSNQLVFQLTDYVLPEDQFKLLHWSEMSDAQVARGKLVGFENVPVINSTREYTGSGQLYYVSTSGDDSNSGRSSGSPFRTVTRAQTAAEPGDFILLKRGDTWDTRVIVTKSGRPNQYITYASYGSGAKPIIHSKLRGSDKVRGYEFSMCTFAIRGADYIQVDNIHVKTDGQAGVSRTKDDGIQIGDGAKYTVVSNCVAEGIGSHGYYGIRVTVDGLPNTTRPEVVNCEVFNYYANIGTQIWPYDGKHGIEEGGKIENCISRDPIKPNDVVAYVWENLFINRGDFHGFVIRKNKVYNYQTSGIETFGSKNVVVEYNEVYDPYDFNRGGKGIKAGGYNSASQTASGVGELYSENITIRYNKVYNITRGNKENVNAIDVNNSRSGQIYGNLIYNVRDIGIKIPSEPNAVGWDIYNNTVLNCGIDAIQVYTSGPNAANVRIKNNILQGKNADINCIVRGTSKKVTGSNNLLLSGKVGGLYQGQNDMKYTGGKLFVDPSKQNYQLAEGSVAIGAGVPISSYDYGLNGTPTADRTDLGAYEYVSDQPAPTPSPSPEPEPSPTPPKDQPEQENQGRLNYRYYEGSWKVLPDFTKLNVLKQGISNGFDLSVRKREEYFGVVYSGNIQINTSGNYTFYTNSDDGSKLFIDGQQVVNNDELHAPRERSGKISLSKGRHTIAVQFFERTAGEVLDVHYAGPGISKRTIPGNVLSPDEKDTPPSPPEDPTPPTTSENGLRYRYYEGVWSTLPNFASQSVRKQGVVSNFTLGVRQREEDFGVVFTGSIQINSSGNYTFYTNSDDGSKLYIDGKQVVNNDGLHAARERSGSISLSKGRHAIEVQFFERTRNQVLDVRYAGPGVSKQAIPNGALFPDEGQTPPAKDPVPKPEPPTNPTPPTAGKNGLRYQYYEGRWGSLPNFGSLKVIKSGTLDNFSLSPARTDRYFGLVYVGYIKVTKSGSYTFYTTSDDGSMLYINGKQIVDNDKVHPARERSGKVSLNSGYHKIEVRYFENAHGEELTVRYQGPGVSKQTIPSNVLFLDQPSNARTVATADANDSSPERNSVSAQEAGSGVMLYPVPLQEKLTIDLGTAGIKQPVNVTLTDRIGREILRKTIYPNQRRKLSLYLGNTDLLKGVYFVNVIMKGSTLGAFKVLKE